MLRLQPLDVCFQSLGNGPGDGLTPTQHPYQRLVVEVVRNLVGGVLIGRFAGFPNVALGTRDFQPNEPDRLLVVGSSVKVDRPIPESLAVQDLWRGPLSGGFLSLVSVSHSCPLNGCKSVYDPFTDFRLEGKESQGILSP